MASSTYHLNHPTNMSSNHMTMYMHYQMLGNRMGTLIYFIIYVLGYIGNTLAFLTFSSHRMRQSSSSIFLLALSISDIGALLTSIWFFVSDAFSFQPQNYSALACRFRTFFAYVFMDLSSWCIAGLAFDRYLRVRLPIGSKTLCTPRNASIMILLFFLILCGINGHYFSPGIGQERGENRTTAHCLENREAYPNYYYFYKIIWPKVDMIIFCFLPACIMILCNVNIVYLRKKQRHKLENTSSCRQHLSNAQNHTEQSLNGTSALLRPYMVSRKAMERQMSLMMMACVIEFLATTVPVTICLAVLEQVITKKPMFAKNNAILIFIFRMLRVIMYFHFALSFYLYCLTSRIFRVECIQTIMCRKVVLTQSQDPSINLGPNKTDES